MRKSRRRVAVSLNRGEAEADSDSNSEQMNLGPRAGERQEESEEAVVNTGAGGPHWHAVRALC